MYQDIFKQIGLSDNEAVVYDYLLEAGENTAGEIIKNTPLKRGVVYNALSSLMNKGLISEKKIKKSNSSVSIFQLEHPQKLSAFIEKKEDELQKAEKNLTANMSKIVSAFHVTSNKPGVKYFEGEDGIKKVINDTLNAKEIIYSFSDIEAIVKYIDKINKQYVKKREALTIKKHAILLDTKFARDYLKDYYSSITENRFIAPKFFPFNSIMQIYDNKVSFITLSNDNMMGIIIQDKAIYNMQKSIFKFVWEIAKK